jgi:hypothetical protein
MADRMIDAVFLPRGYGAGLTADAKLARIKADFHNMLGGGRIYIRQAGDGFLVAPEEADTLQFPKDHVRAGSDRYTWQDRGDGVRVGVLVPEDAPIEAETGATMAAVEKLRARLTVPGAPQ